ncbi:hypothetical protein ACFVR1_06025 [Psychrobacillus sp. NPDC058041]|uniref:hypothetical protein n=1 Tax=Psychrobacillus sp. NPDC058041 TaxID=3346310 RepID=UPI0036DD20FB
MNNVCVVQRIDEYLHHYNEERIQEKLGYLNAKRIWNCGSLIRFFICVSYL